jgi:hypothetical protein
MADDKLQTVVKRSRRGGNHCRFASGESLAMQTSIIMEAPITARSSARADGSQIHPSVRLNLINISDRQGKKIETRRASSELLGDAAKRKRAKLTITSNGGHDPGIEMGIDMIGERLRLDEHLDSIAKRIPNSASLRGLNAGRSIFSQNRSVINVYRFVSFAHKIEDSDYIACKPLKDPHLESYH